jgi:hypothetical protein
MVERGYINILFIKENQFYLIFTLLSFGGIILVHKMLCVQGFIIEDKKDDKDIYTIF